MAAFYLCRMTTTASPVPFLSPAEGRLLFALLDAADDQGLLVGTPCQGPWLVTRRQLIATNYHEAASAWGLLVELEHCGALNGSWIQRRWRSVKARIEQNGA